MAKMEVYTFIYEASTGEKPSGFANWFFCVPDGSWMVCLADEYSKAKQEAIDKAVADGVKASGIILMP